MARKKKVKDWRENGDILARHLAQAFADGRDEIPLTEMAGPDNEEILLLSFRTLHDGKKECPDDPLVILAESICCLDENHFGDIMAEEGAEQYGTVVQLVSQYAAGNLVATDNPAITPKL